MMEENHLSNEWEAYLGSSEFCDCEDPKIQRQAQALVQDAGNPKEAAQHIFYFVRDGILFGMDHCDVRASETLEKGFGFCITKTNLQVALLRAAGIPARYHQAELRKDSLRGIIPELALKFMPTRIWWHPWCECAPSKKWIACDTLLDRSLYEGLTKKGVVDHEQIPNIDWDAESDLNMMQHWMLEDVGSFPFLDSEFRRVEKEVLPPRILSDIFFALSNRYTSRLRLPYPSQ